MKKEEVREGRVRGREEEGGRILMSESKERGVRGGGWRPPHERQD